MFFFRIKNLVLTTFIYVLFYLLKRTWKVVEEPYPKDIQDRIDRKEHVVFAHFHEDEWALLGAYANRKMAALVSLSKDGELMSGFLKKLGFDVHRGSSSKGGAAGFISALRSVQKSPDAAQLCFAVDGPRGPRRVAKKGVIKAAQILNAPVIGGAVYVNRLWIFKKSWSRGFLPKPFSTIYICYGDVISAQEIQADAKSDRMEVLCAKLESKLMDAKRLAEKIMRSNA